jgi:hypothetical protein
MNPTLKAGPPLTVTSSRRVTKWGQKQPSYRGDTNLSQPDQEHYDGTRDGEHPGPKIEEVTPAAAEDQ